MAGLNTPGIRSQPQWPTRCRPGAQGSSYLCAPPMREPSPSRGVSSPRDRASRPGTGPEGKYSLALRRWCSTLSQGVREQAKRGCHDVAHSNADCLHWNVRARPNHDATLQPFITDRLAKSVTSTTVNRSLEVVRTVLNRCARAYRDEDGRPWLTGMPPLIKMFLNRAARPTPSPGRTRTVSFRGCPRVLPEWHCSRSTRDYAKAMCANCNGPGRWLCPRSVEVSS